MKDELENPFLMKEYESPSYFCDRKDETKLLLDNARNGLNTTLISVRRMGKTGLLHHVLHNLTEKKEGLGIYVDLYDTENLKDFTNRVANAILQTVQEKHPFWKKAFQFIKRLRPVISIDELSGMPEVMLDYTTSKQFESSLLEIFNFLELQEQPILVAIDEFQQITNYPEKNIEAILRTKIQTLRNVQFVFSGSSPHILAEMFHSSKRPFFMSTLTLSLDKINAIDYAEFIRFHFENRKRQIDDEAIDFILEFSKRHTFYTQLLCHRTFQNGHKKVTLESVHRAAYELLQLNEVVYFQYRNMLTSNQWKLLRAIAKEDKLTQPNAASFIQKYQLGSASSVQRALKSLMDTEMIYIEHSPENYCYRVYDCFLARWLERK